MKRKGYKRKMLHAVSDFRCEQCKPDFRHKLILPEQVMSTPIVDHTSYSMVVYAQAFLLAMQELTGGVDSEFSIRLLNECKIEVAKGHRMELR